MKQLFIILLFIGGIALGIGLQQQGMIPSFSAMDHADSSDMAETSNEKKVAYWVAPMDANFRRDKPGKSPMGMELVAVYEADQSDDEDSVKISPSVINNMGVRSAVVSYGTLNRNIQTLGHIAYDEDKMSHVHLRTEGWIERLKAKSVGDPIRRGQLLFQLYSPELVNAQEEFIQVKRSGNKGLIKASKRRLLALGMTKRQINQLSKSKKVTDRTSIYAAQNGVVTALKIREGMFVKPAQTIMSLADLSTVWLIADVFEHQSNWLKVGQKVTAQLAYYAGKTWQGKIDFIYPELDPVTKTLRVRIKLANPDKSLKPNMYAKVSIDANSKAEVLSIPKAALIRSGSGNRVIIDLGKGYYQARMVKIGMETDDWIEIMTGLKAADRVVISGQFLIDSEASLNASFMRMSAADPMLEETMPEGMVMDDDMNDDEDYEESVYAAAKATINKTMPMAHKINVTHEAIKVFGWSVMTMDIDVSEDIDLTEFKKGQKIHFEIEKQGNQFTIHTIHALGGMK